MVTRLCVSTKKKTLLTRAFVLRGPKKTKNFHTTIHCIHSVFVPRSPLLRVQDTAWATDSPSADRPIRKGAEGAYSERFS